MRTRVIGSAQRPRMSVYKSNRYVYAQLIDDERGVTLAHATSFGVSGKTPLERAQATGRDVAKKAKKKKISKVVFDRGGRMYTGHVRAVAEGAREEGLVF